MANPRIGSGKTLTSLRIAVTAATLLLACGTSGGGGGGGFVVGGPAGASCAPATTNEGCFSNQRVHCDPATATWSVIEPCAANTVCILTAAAAGAFVSSCAAQGTATGPDGGGSNDGTVSASDGGASTAKDGQTAGDAVSADAVKEVTVIGPDGCGNGTCDTGETPASCPSDCSKAVCGNAKCEAGESPTSCPKDCGTQAVCGNGSCEPGETAAACPTDCKVAAVCGNGKCESGETATSCAKDCSLAACCASKGAVCGTIAGCSGSCGTCAPNQTCAAGKCTGGSSGSCIEQYCQTEWDACVNDDLCVGIIGYLVISACGKKAGCTDGTCVQQNCAKEVQQCNQTPGCVTFLTCLNKCQNDACAQACVDKANGALYTALSDCAQSNCP